jgi:putative pyruvate formate lyase activating enzyme
MNSTDYYSSCTQCPRCCGVNRTKKQKGICGETDEVRIATVCLHYGEEPLVTVHGGSGTIFFTGCTLRCAFCQNYQISQDGTGRTVDCKEFVEMCLRLQQAGAENINLVTGSHIIPRLAEYLAAARSAGCTIPYCWNSSSYENIEMLTLLKPLVTIWLPDLKTLSTTLAAQLFGAADYPEAAKKAVIWMMNNFPLKIDNRTVNGITKEKIEQGVIIRHLFLPGRFEETADTLDWLKKNADNKAVISLMSQYTPVPFNENETQLVQRKKALAAIENRLVTTQEDNDIRDLIEAYDFNYLFYQDLSDDTSWLPDFNRIQPFSNTLAKPFWHWTNGFIV